MKGIKEHYVPQFYLKNFGDKIYLYDKQNNKVSQSTPRNVAFQRNFYANNNDAASKIEHEMSQFEGDANRVLSNIIKTESVTGLSDTDRAVLCLFVALQFARTPEFRDWRHDMIQSVLDVLKHRGITDPLVEEQEERVKSAHLDSMFDYVDLAGPYLLRMRVCLLKNNTDMPLWTSDNPVVRDNVTTGKLGLDSPDVQFYLPLTPKLLFMLYDDTHMDIMDDLAAAAGISEESRAWVRNSIPEVADVVKQNVIYYNQLQARFSTRFVFSSKRRFPMMKAFLEENKGYKKRHVFHGSDWYDPAGNTENHLGMSGAGALDSNLQNAIWYYRKAKQERDMRQAFIHLCMSLVMITRPEWNDDEHKNWVDDRVRKLTGDPALSLDRFRQIHNRISRNEHPDPHMDGARMAKDVKALRQIVAKMIQGRIRELRAND